VVTISAKRIFTTCRSLFKRLIELDVASPKLDPTVRSTVLSAAARASSACKHLITALLRQSNIDHKTYRMYTASESLGNAVAAFLQACSVLILSSSASSSSSAVSPSASSAEVAGVDGVAAAAVDDDSSVRTNHSAAAADGAAAATAGACAAEEDASSGDISAAERMKHIKSVLWPDLAETVQGLLQAAMEFKRKLEDSRNSGRTSPSTAGFLRNAQEASQHIRLMSNCLQHSDGNIDHKEFVRLSNLAMSSVNALIEFSSRNGLRGEEESLRKASLGLFSSATAAFRSKGVGDDASFGDDISTFLEHKAQMADAIKALLVQVKHKQKLHDHGRLGKSQSEHTCRDPTLDLLSHSTPEKAPKEGADEDEHGDEDEAVKDDTNDPGKVIHDNTRLATIEDLLAAEKDYVDILSAVKNHYMEKLRPLISEEQFALLFDSLEPLLEETSRRFADLQELLESEDPDCLVGPVFEHTCPSYHVYGPYILNFDRVLLSIGELARSPATRSVIEQAKSHSGLSLDLGGCLMQPAQQLRKYQKLLLNIYEATEKGFADRSAIQSCIKRLVNLNQRIDDSKRIQLNTNKLISLSDSLTNIASFDLLLDPHRHVFIREGELQVRWQNGFVPSLNKSKATKKVTFYAFLLDEVMILTKPKRKASARCYEVKKVIPMAHARMESCEASPVGGSTLKKSDQSLSWILKVALPDESTSATSSPTGVCYFFYVATEASRQTWMEAVLRCTEMNQLDMN